MKRSPLVAATLGVLAMAASCGSNPVTIEQFDRVQFPAVASDAVIEFENGSSIESLTISELESIEMLRVDLYEPFVEADTDFEGPSLDAVAKRLGWPSDGTVHILALNDYAYDLTLAALVGSHAMIATREHGLEIPIERGGPARIVFPDGTDVSPIEDAWVWSLERLTLDR